MFLLYLGPCGPSFGAGGLSNILPSTSALETKILAEGFQRGPGILSRVPFGLFFWFLFLQKQEKERFRPARGRKSITQA